MIGDVTIESGGISSAQIITALQGISSQARDCYYRWLGSDR